MRHCEWTSWRHYDLAFMANNDFIQGRGIGLSQEITGLTVCIIVSKEMRTVTKTDRASDLQCYVIVTSWRQSQCSPIALPYIFYLLGIVWKSLLHLDYILSSWIFSMFCNPYQILDFLIVTPCMTSFTSHMTSVQNICVPRRDKFFNWCHSETGIFDGELPGDDCCISNGPGDSIEKACAFYSVHYGIFFGIWYLYGRFYTYVVEWNCFLPEQMCIYQAFIHMFFWVQIWIFMLVGPKCSMLHFFVTKQTSYLYMHGICTSHCVPKKRIP